LVVYGERRYECVERELVEWQHEQQQQGHERQLCSLRQEMGRPSLPKMSYFTFENLYKAYLDCRKRKTNTLNHLAFTENLEVNLLNLEKRLQNRTYRPGRSIAFVVRRPKIREVFAADFRDRVVHHLLFNYLSPIFEKVFIYDSWACRKEKGTHQAMLRLQEFAN